MKLTAIPIHSHALRALHEVEIVLWIVREEEPDERFQMQLCIPESKYEQEMGLSFIADAGNSVLGEVCYARNYPSRSRFHRLWIMKARPALPVQLVIFHNASDYSVGVIACQVDQNIFRSKVRDTWDVWAIEKMRLYTNSQRWKLTCIRCHRIPSLSTEHTACSQQPYGLWIERYETMVISH